MERIPQHDHPARAPVAVAVNRAPAASPWSSSSPPWVVVVAPEQQLLEDEEGEDPPQDEARGARGRLRFLEEVRQQVEKHHLQQGAHGEAHQRGDPALLHARGDKCGDGEREQGSRHAREEDGGETGRLVIAPSR